MPSDRSRSSDHPRNGYTGVVAQQGRVILDRDFNAGQELTAARIAADAIDFVGPCGTPDDGFRISVLDGSPPSAPYWTPLLSPPAESPPSSPGSTWDFLISPGTMYVGGERVEFPAEQDGTIVTYSYFDQPDWPLPAQPDAPVSRELVYLDVAEQEVSAVEDPDLLDVALGGPDTTQRRKLLRRVLRMPVPATDCANAWAAAQQAWKQEGLEFDPATMRLRPLARLQVGFTQDSNSSDPCDPVATGGYLAPDNQLIRVRIDGSASARTVLWGYDNASFLYLVTSVDPTRTTLTLASAPPDALHVPQTNQVLEVLATAAVFGSEPTGDPVGAHSILRVAAEPTGTVTALGPPVTGAANTTIVLANPLPPSVAYSEWPLFLRVWQGVQTWVADTAIPLIDPVRGNTGVTVTISVPSGAPPAYGSFWQIAVRPATPQTVYPVSLQTTPKPPDGPRRWVCPLAVIDWTTSPPAVTDCRNSFDNLVELSRRKPGCCTVSIGPEDVSAALTLQAQIDIAVGQAAAVTVCLAPGSYVLPAPLRLSEAHSGLTLESCGGGQALLVADPGTAPALFVDGLVVLSSAHAATLRGLALRIPFAPLNGKLAGSSFVGYGVRAFDSTNLTVEDCVVEVTGDAPATADYLLTAGLLLQGDCSGLTVRGGKMGSTIAPSYTPVVNQSATTANPVTTATPVTTAVPVTTATTITTATPVTTATPGTTATPEPEPRIIDRLAVAPVAKAAPAAAPSPQVSDALVRFESTLRPASPDISKATLLINRASAITDVLNARLPTAPVAKKNPVIASIGIAAFDYTGDGATTLDCQLGQTTIRDVTFSNLAFATLINAAASSLQLQDNNVLDCVAGLWYLVPDDTAPDSTTDKNDTTYPTSVEFEEFLVTGLLHVQSAPPIAYRDPVLRSVVRQPVKPTVTAIDDRAVPALRVLVEGNRVDPTGANAGAGAGASLALLLALNGPQITTFETVGNLSVIVVANHLRSASGDYIPAALLTLPGEQPCAITGNVILNISAATRNRYGPSLWLMIADSGDGISLVSVSGNVLLSNSNLPELTRLHSSPPSTWFSYNANPY